MKTIIIALSMCLLYSVISLAQPTTMPLYFNPMVTQNNTHLFIEHPSNFLLDALEMANEYAIAKAIGEINQGKHQKTAIPCSTEPMVHNCSGDENTITARLSEALQARLDNAFPSTGNNKALVILVDYYDAPHTYPKSNLYNMLNQFEYDENGNAGSVSDYFFDQSFGQLDLDFELTNWLRMSKHQGYYANRANELVSEAIAKAEQNGVDFSRYDNNNDGKVDAVMIVHAGLGKEQTLNPNHIWSKHSHLSHSGPTYDNVKIDKYLILPEKSKTAYYTNNDPANIHLATIGVYCHEFGHALGIPDLYDGDASDGNSSGIGRWGVMSGGFQIDYGKTPCQFNAWSKTQLGWITPIEVNSIMEGVTMTHSGISGQCYKVNTTIESEYFLIEYRKKEGWDSYLAGEGLFIWHIDESQANNNNAEKFLIGLENADGNSTLYTENVIGDAGDPYPGTSNNSKFNKNSTPNSKTNNGDESNVCITNIEEIGEGIRFDIGCIVSGKDITLRNMIAHTEGHSNSIIQVKGEIVTSNTNSVGASTLQVLLSDDETLSPDDIRLDNFPISNLSSNNPSVAFDKLVTLSGGIAAGEYYLIIVADYTNTIFESNENNNKATLPIEILSGSASDIVIENINTVASANRGTSITVSCHARNKDGTGYSPKSTTAI